MTKAKNSVIEVEKSALTPMSFISMATENLNFEKAKHEAIDLHKTSYKTEAVTPPTKYQSIENELSKETLIPLNRYNIFTTFHRLHYQYSDIRKIDMMKTALHHLHIMMQDGADEKYSVYLRQFHELIEKNRNPNCFNKLGIPISKCPDLIELIYRLLFLALHPTHQNNSAKGINILHIKELASDTTSAKTVHLMWAARVKKSKMHALVDDMLKMHEDNLKNLSSAKVALRSSPS